MLRSVRLVNLRSLGDTKDIELRPLVVLVGANSSGKSTLLRFFPLLRQTSVTPSSSPLLWFGDDVDFGDFRQAVRGHDTSRTIGVGLTFDAPRRARPASILAQIGCDDKGHTHVVQFSISGGEDPTVDPEARLTISLSGALEAISQGDVDFRAILTGQRVVEGRNLIPALPSLDQVLDGPETDKYGELEIQSDNCRIALDQFARGVRYLGPLRAGPQRYYRRQELAIDQVTRDGANLAMLLNGLSVGKMREFSEWTREFFGFGLETAAEGAHVVLRVLEADGIRMNLIDTGFGLSQLFPVVAQAWLTIDTAARGPKWGSPDLASLLAIEQPELHLHPRHQAQLADMFAGLVGALKDVKRECPVLVETHSEALINRLGELIHEKKLGREDVSVLVFERDEAGTTQVRRAEFDDQGVLQNWPLGFFLA